MDLNRAHRLAAEFDAHDFEGLIEFAFEELHPEVVGAEMIRQVGERMGRSTVNVRRWLQFQEYAGQIGLDPARETALDIGCGNGSMALVLSGHFDRVTATDISMEELVLAKRFLADNNVSNVELICCESELLPFGAGAFDFINATSVIEHFSDQKVALGEMERVLRTKGIVSLDSPNRYDPIYPEPHVNVRWVGFMPRLLQGAFVKLASGQSYVGKRPLSLRELRALLSEAFGERQHAILYWPRWNDGGAGQTRIGGYLAGHARLRAAANLIWARFVNSHEVLAWKQGQAGIAFGIIAIDQPLKAHE